MLPSLSYGQAFREILVDPADNGKILSEFLEQLETTYALDFIYDERTMRALTLTGIVEKQRFSDYLNDHLGSFRVFRYDDRIIFILDKEKELDYALRKENFLILKTTPLDRPSLMGKVADEISQEPLIGARIYLPQTRISAAADAEGDFEIELPESDIIELDAEYIGYESSRHIIGFSTFGTLTNINITLLPQSRELESVTITAERLDANVTAKITGVEKLNMEIIKTMPAFLGEVDPIRSLTMLPGVSTSGELASGFHVRGGESGQNLVLQDGAVMYNPSHLFGFFSAFNPDMINNVTLYKGGGPATFGGRISSVLDVSLRNGDAGKHAVSGGVGLISSRLSVEGPLARNKSSYLVGGRISYANWLVHATDNIALGNSAANFSDITGKIFHTLNANNYLTLSAYHSYDAFKLATDSVFSWSTANFSLKWDHTFNENTSSALSLVSSNYASEVHSINEIDGFRYYNGIRNAGLKFGVTHGFNEGSKVLAGIESHGNWMEPGKLTPDAHVDNIPPENMQDQRSIESALYVQSDNDLSEKWSLSAGVRYGYFLRFGKEDIYRFDYETIDGRYPSIRDTVLYGTGEVISRYSGLEPRISLRYLIDNSSSIKASYFRGFQYLHMISNTSSSTPQDYWITSGPHIKPQRGDQYSLGFFKNVRDNRYEFSVEGFYKEMQNAVDFIEGADITLNAALEAGLSQGKGKAYGLEVFLKKSTGRAHGWLSYTYARSLRQFKSDGRNMAINDGAYYPSYYDQPHHLSAVFNYQLGGRSFLSANFNYSTGRPITIPVSKFSYTPYLAVLNYSDRNGYRIPDYHRLDVSITVRDKPRKNKRLRSEWVFSLFNVYSRKNTYSISFDRYGNASKLSVLGSIFPSVNYNFSF